MRSLRCFAEGRAFRTERDTEKHHSKPSAQVGAERPGTGECRSHEVEQNWRVLESHPILIRRDTSNPKLQTYACSMAGDFARLLSRICSVVNSPPQTLQRQPGDAARAITDTPC
jgi:hypothetical protein